MSEQDVGPDDAEFGMSDHQSHNSLRAERDRAEKERDEARDYAAQARIRENETEDRRIHDTDKLRAELAEERKHT